MFSSKAVQSDISDQPELKKSENNSDCDLISTDILHCVIAVSFQKRNERHQMSKGKIRRC